MKTRFLFDDMHRHLHHKNALVITGMRQVGKTTLMRQLFDELPADDRLWFDLDNPLDQKIFERQDYSALYADLRARTRSTGSRLYVCIDEIQNAPSVTKVIKYLIDHYGVKFIVTGSSSFYLKNLFPESLSGRKFLYELTPLSFLESLYFQGKVRRSEVFPLKRTRAFAPAGEIDRIRYERDYEQYMRYGGFPEVVLTSNNATKKVILKNIFSSFFEKDILLLSDFTDIRRVRDLILLLAPRVGSMIDITKLAAELAVSRPTVYDFLAFLEGSFFIRLVSKYSASIDRSVAGGKKIYFADTGLLRMVAEVNEGQLFENTVFNQLSHYGSLTFYNRRNTAEIDFILDKKVAIEIKVRGVMQDSIRTGAIAKTLGIKQTFVVSKALPSTLHKTIIAPVTI